MGKFYLKIKIVFRFHHHPIQTFLIKNIKIVFKTNINANKIENLTEGSTQINLNKCTNFT